MPSEVMPPHRGEPVIKPNRPPSSGCTTCGNALAHASWCKEGRVKPERTIAFIGKRRMSGTACSDCGTSYARCTESLLKPGRVCCRSCQHTGTHNERLEADPRPSRAQYALDLAEVVKTPAACTRRQVGCVILDKDKRIAATGYNGTAAGEVHCTDGGCPRGRYTHDEIPKDLGNTGHEVKCVAKHAEENATEWALAHGTDPATSLVAITEAPCATCLPMLHEQGWGEIVWPGGSL